MYGNTFAGRLRQRRPPHACTGPQAQVNTIIRDWMPRQAAEADQVFQDMYGATLAERFTPDKYQLMHIEMFPHVESIQRPTRQF